MRSVGPVGQPSWLAVGRVEEGRVGTLRATASSSSTLDGSRGQRDVRPLALAALGLLAGLVAVWKLGGTYLERPGTEQAIPLPQVPQVQILRVSTIVSADPSRRFVMTGGADASAPEPAPPPAAAPAPPPPPPEPARNASAVQTLFCLALTSDDGRELALLEQQRASHTGVFGCDAYSIFTLSGRSLGGDGTAGAPAIATTAIGGTLSTSKYNTAEFIRVWHKVLEEGTFRQHTWVVKVDPDAVMFPDRLRSRLAQQPAGSAGSPVAVLNCVRWHSMQGPLEVLSRAGAETFLQGMDRCAQQGYMTERGEDWFIGQCLGYLGIPTVEAYDLLADWYCNAPLNDCTLDRVAFHPFKTPEVYTACLNSATAAGAQRTQ